MRALHLFFRLHRPYTLKFDGARDELLGGEAEFREANRTEYQPFFALVERSTQKYPALRFTLAISGLWLEMAEKWDPELIRRLRRLVNRGAIELVATPYYYSLANFYNPDEFSAQIAACREKIAGLLGAETSLLALPELIYNDKIATFAEEQGFSGIIAGAAEGILDYRSPNQVFEAEDCKNLRVIFQNTRFSRAIRRAEPLAMVEAERAKEDFSATSASSDAHPLEPRIPAKARKKSTAAEFVRGFTGAEKRSAPAARAAAPISVRSQGSGIQVFSARKFKKELELESLRAPLITLALDTQIFSEYQSAGIVRFFDELLASWFMQPQNRCLSASEAINLHTPTATISVKTTIDWRGGEVSESSGVLARLKDIQFCPPVWLATSAQVRAARILYNLLPDLQKAKSDDLYRDFCRLTALDYLIQYNPLAPPLVRTHDRTGEGNFSDILERFSEMVAAKLPQPPKLAAGPAPSSVASENATPDAATDKPASPDTATVSADTPAAETPADDAPSPLDDAPEDIKVTIKRKPKKPAPKPQPPAPTKPSDEASRAPASTEPTDDAPEEIKVTIKKKPKTPPPSALAPRKTSSGAHSSSPSSRPSAPASKKPTPSAPKPARCSLDLVRSAPRPAENPQPEFADWDELIMSEDWDEDLSEEEIMAEHIYRQQSEARQDLDALVEAELVPETKLRKLKKLVIE